MNTIKTGDPVEHIELPAHDEAQDEIAAARPAPLEESPAAPPVEAPARAERDELKDRLLRITAEFDNYRKRVDRERRELAEFAAADLIRELLPVIDDLERALAAAPDAAADTPAVERYRSGVELIHRQLLDLLRKRNVIPIEAEGADFDPHVHQAVAREASADHREGEILEELRRGYKLGDRLLRPAMVKVASRE
jgi:molecular chaperone GrpE